MQVEEKETGKYASKAAHYVSSIAYLERGSRPDIAKALHLLQQALHCWTTKQDRFLEWLFQYLETHWDLVLLHLVDPSEVFDLAVVPKSDSSFADEELRRRSTNGYVVCIEGKRTFALIDWRTAFMTAQALHTQEAEASSILRATRAAIPIEMQMTAQLGLEEEMPVEGENDNKAAVSAIVGGGITKTLRHARRTHGLSAAFLSDYYQKHKRNLKWRSGKGFAPDSFTKILSREDFEPIRDELGLAKLEHLSQFEPYLMHSETAKSTPQVETLHTERAERIKARDEKRKRKIERARETEKMLREKFATWCSTKDLDMMVHRTLGHSMCLASGLGAQEEGCLTCPKAKQRRKGHSSVAVKPHDRSRHWGGDSCGIITPPSYQMHRYFHAVHDEGLGYEQNIPVRSKHSKLSAEALEDFAKEVKHYPVGWPDDGGEEYEGEVIEWFKQVGHKNGKPVAEFKSN